MRGSWFEVTDWAEMRPAQFDRTQFKGRARRVADESAGTLFPALLPEPNNIKPARPAPPDPCGTGDLLELLAGEIE